MQKTGKKPWFYHNFPIFDKINVFKQKMLYLELY